MSQITLYHRGLPVTNHPLRGPSFSIGKQHSNDLVLAGSGVAEEPLVIYRSAGGGWRARLAKAGLKPAETDFAPGTRIALGPFSVELDAARPASPKNETETDDLNIAGVSLQIRLMRREIGRLGPLRAPVLITGETGTGKELIAKGLHGKSNSPDLPFVAVNCGGLTASLLEDTLFGHERGAFTGALRARQGVFEQAAGGTLFLDEIGELPISQQAALLRILDEKKVTRVGGEKEIAVDFRLLAATNRDLHQLIEEGLFRLDLYHRIAALQIGTTPLRERRDDIEPLADLFLSQMAAEVGSRSLTPDAVDQLARHPWPGNARELYNALYRAAARSSQTTLRAGDFDDVPNEHKPKGASFRLDQVPNASIDALLQEHHGNVAAAARALGVPRTSLRDRLNRGAILPTPPAASPGDRVCLAS